MGIKELFLNKGWAGRTMDRQETVERVNPVVKGLTELLHYYLDAESRLNESGRAVVAQALRTLRADIGKLSETVLSAGGVAYAGTDLEPGELRLGEQFLSELMEREASFCRETSAQNTEDHQIRTRAILAKVTENGAERLRMLRALGGR